MTLGKVGLAASLTTIRKAGIFRQAMEGMRNHLEQVLVGYQRTEPDTTFMIESLVGIYEAMFRISSLMASRKMSAVESMLRRASPC